MQQGPRPVIHVEKQLGWALKLSGAESREIPGRSNSLGQVEGLDCQMWHQLPGSAWEGSKKGQWSAHLRAAHFILSLYTTGAFQAATPVVELRGSESQ